MTNHPNRKEGYAGNRQHIARDDTRTFCGNLIKQPKGRLFVGQPSFCTCRVCLTKFYEGKQP